MKSGLWLAHGRKLSLPACYDANPFGEVITSSSEAKGASTSLHRGHRLTKLRRGKTENFSCPYHGWQYDGGGILKTIPGAAKYYGEPAKALQQSASIQKVNAVRVGDFVFINPAENQISISDQFDEYVIAGLELTRDKIGPSMVEMTFELPFNWKLIFENLRDGLHPTFLHKTSLTNEVHFSFADTYKGETAKKDLDLMDISNFSADGEHKGLNPSHRDGFELIGSENRNLNWLLFPYTHIVSPDGGALISIENYVPVSPDKTRLELRLHITKSLGNSSPIPVLRRWLGKVMVVLKEDFDAVISVQQNARVSNMEQHLGNYESFNHSVNKWFEKHIYG